MFASTHSPEKPWREKTARLSLLAEMAEQEARVAERLRELRVAYGANGKPMTQEDAAHRAGVKYRQWQRWEAAEAMPRTRSLERVAVAFGLDVAEFYTRSDERAQAVATTSVEEAPAWAQQLQHSIDMLLALAVGETTPDALRDELEAELEQRVREEQQAARLSAVDAPSKRGRDRLR